MKTAWIVSAALAALCVGGALAGETHSPQSIWNIGTDGVARHVQSGWVCPAAFGDYHLGETHAYDAFGLDVSCDYRLDDAEITLYLTKFSGGDLQAAFAEAEKAMVEKPNNAGGVPVADHKSFPSARPWLHAVYGGQGGRMRTGVWYAWYGDWAFEIRATYPTAREDATMALLAKMTDEAANNAGAHLDLCLKSKPPTRDGKVPTDDNTVMAGVLLLMAEGGPSTERDKDGHVIAEHAPLLPHTWCVEGPVDGFDLPMLSWHAVDETGKVQGFDRVTLMTIGPAPEMMSRHNALGETIGMDFEGAEPSAKLPDYTVARKDGANWVIYGVYLGRPEIAALARFLADDYRGQDKPLAKVDPETNNIKVFFEPKK